MMDLLVACGLCASKSEARRNIQQGGVFAGDEKVTAIDAVVTEDQLRAGVKLRRGKKAYNRAVLEA